MADDTLARMFWARVDRGPSRPSQQFKQGGTWKTLTRKEVGDAVREVLSYVQYEPERLRQEIRRECERAVRDNRLSVAESQSLTKAYEGGLAGYTYLE